MPAGNYILDNFIQLCLEMASQWLDSDREKGMEI